MSLKSMGFYEKFTLSSCLLIQAIIILMVPFLIGLLFTSLTFAEECGAPAVPEEQLANTMCLFQRPLVIGASVSAGYGTGTGGPAAILSRSLNPGTRVTNRSISGATSMSATSFFPRELPSIVLGFDMFFWDTVRSTCDEEFETQTRAFFRRYQSAGVPMVIGKIPVNAPFPMGVRLAGRAACTAKINALIQQECTIDKNCLVYDPKDCLSAMGSMTSPSGVPYFQDPVHPTTAGNTFCAEHFAQHARYKQLHCKTR